MGAEVGHEARLFIVAQGDALVVVVAEAGEHKDGLLRKRQNPALLRGHRDAIQRMHVQHALRIVAGTMDCAVDGEAGRIHREWRVIELVAVHVHAHEA